MRTGQLLLAAALSASVSGVEECCPHVRVQYEGPQAQLLSGDYHRVVVYSFNGNAVYKRDGSAEYLYVRVTEAGKGHWAVGSQPQNGAFSLQSFRGSRCPLSNQLPTPWCPQHEDAMCWQAWDPASSKLDYAPVTVTCQQLEDGFDYATGDYATGDAVCQERVDENMLTFWALVAGLVSVSAILTVLMLILLRYSAPIIARGDLRCGGAAVVVLALVALFKLGVGIGLFSVLLHCPTGCKCTIQPESRAYFMPVIEVLLGLLWINRARRIWLLMGAPRSRPAQGLANQEIVPSATTVINQTQNHIVLTVPAAPPMQAAAPSVVQGTPVEA